MGLMGKLKDNLDSDTVTQTAGKTDDPAMLGIDEAPVYASPSFLYHNGRYFTVVKLYCRPGTNRFMHFDDVIDIIPISNNAIDLTMLVTDTALAESLKRRLIRDNASGGKLAVEDTVEHGSRTDNDQANLRIYSAEIEDYNTYEEIIDSADPVISFSIKLIIAGDTQELVETQLKDLNVALSQRHEGLQWDSVAGQQMDSLVSLLDKHKPGSSDHTSTGANYGGINFAVSPGLNDYNGLPIGIDAMSISGSSSMMDFDGYLKHTALIATAPSSVVPRFVREDDSSVPASSVISQSIANHACMNGHRAHHLVFNEFDYFEDGLFYRPIESKEIFTRFDVSKMTVNPLQGFARNYNDLTGVFSRLTAKIVNIFNVLEDFKLTQDDKAIILTAIENFYFNHSLWITDAELYPRRTRIINIERPETYPTMGTLIHEFSSLAVAAARDNRELKADRVETLYNILNHALSSHVSVLGRPTSVHPSDAIQVFYEFNNIESEQMKQVQALNLLDYVLYTCDDDDVLVLHGCDKLYESVLAQLLPSIISARRRNIRTVLSFDSISSRSTPLGDTATMYALKGPLFNDLDTDIDYTVLGRCLPNEVDMFETALNMQLSTAIKAQLMSKNSNLLLIHRSAGNINNFVYAGMII